MFRNAGSGNARKTPKYLTAVYPTIEIVGVNIVRLGLVISLAVTGEETLFDVEVDLQEIELSSPASLPAISGQIPPEFDHS